MKVRECTWPPSLVVEWLCAELEVRGIPGTVYSHTLLSLLHSHYCSHNTHQSSYCHKDTAAVLPPQQCCSCCSAAAADDFDDALCSITSEERLLEHEEELILGQSLHPDADLPLVPHPKTPKKSLPHVQQSACCVSRRARKRHKKQQHLCSSGSSAQSSPQQLQKLTALQCLVSASDQKRDDLESLIEKLCDRLQVHRDGSEQSTADCATPPPPPPPSTTLRHHKLTSHSSKEGCTEKVTPVSDDPLNTAKRYFEAFPALPEDSTRTLVNDSTTECAWGCRKHCLHQNNAIVTSPEISLDDANNIRHCFDGDSLASAKDSSVEAAANRNSISSPGSTLHFVSTKKESLHELSYSPTASNEFAILSETTVGKSTEDKKSVNQQAPDQLIENQFINQQVICKIIPDDDLTRKNLGACLSFITDDIEQTPHALPQNNYSNKFDVSEQKTNSITEIESSTNVIQDQSTERDILDAISSEIIIQQTLKNSVNTYASNHAPSESSDSKIKDLHFMNHYIDAFSNDDQAIAIKIPDNCSLPQSASHADIKYSVENRSNNVGIQSITTSWNAQMLMLNDINFVETSLKRQEFEPTHGNDATFVDLIKHSQQLEGSLGETFKDEISSMPNISSEEEKLRLKHQILLLNRFNLKNASNEQQSNEVVSSTNGHALQTNRGSSKNEIVQLLDELVDGLFEQKTVSEQEKARSRGMERSDQMPSVVHTSGPTSSYQDYSQFFVDQCAPRQHHSLATDAIDDLKLQRFVGNQPVNHGDGNLCAGNAQVATTTSNGDGSHMLSMVSETPPCPTSSAAGDGKVISQWWQTCPNVEDPLDGYVGDISSRESSQDRADYDDALADDEDEDGCQNYDDRMSKIAETKLQRLEEQKIIAMNHLAQVNLEVQKQMLGKAGMQHISALFNQHQQSLPQQQEQEQKMYQQFQQKNDTRVGSVHPNNDGNLGLPHPDQIFDKLMYESQQPEKPNVPMQQGYARVFDMFNQQNVNQMQQSHYHIQDHPLPDNEGEQALYPQCDQEVVIKNYLSPSGKLPDQPLASFQQTVLRQHESVHQSYSNYVNENKNIWSDMNANSITSSLSDAFAVLNTNKNINASHPTEGGVCDEDQYLCKTFQSLGLERIWGRDNLENLDDESAKARQQMLQSGSLCKQTERVDLRQFLPDNKASVDMWLPSAFENKSIMNSTDPGLAASLIINPVFMRLVGGCDGNDTPISQSSATNTGVVGCGVVSQQHSLLVRGVSGNTDCDLVTGVSGPGGVQAVLQHSNNSNFSSVVPRRTDVLDAELLKPTTACDVPTTTDENLLTSPRTHFRPIKLQDETTANATIGTFTSTSTHVPLHLPYQRSNSGTLYLEKDVIDGSPKKYMIYKDPADKAQEHRPLYMTSQESSLIPKFKVVKNEKFCQTDDTSNERWVNDEPTAAAMMSSYMTPPPESDEDYDVFSFQKDDFVPISDSNQRQCWNETDVNKAKENFWKVDNGNNSISWLRDVSNLPVHGKQPQTGVQNKNISESAAPGWSSNMQITPCKLYYRGTGSSGSKEQQQDRIIDTPAARAIWSSDPNTTVTASGQHYHQAVIAAQHVDPAIKALWADLAPSSFGSNKSPAKTLLLRTDTLPAWTMKARENSSIEKQIPTEWITEESIKCADDQQVGSSRNNTVGSMAKPLPSGFGRNDVWSCGNDKDDWRKEEDCEEYCQVRWSGGEENNNNNATTNDNCNNWWSTLTAARDDDKDPEEREQHLADLAALMEAQNWEKAVSMGESGAHSCHEEKAARQQQQGLEELDPGWPLQEGFVWDPQHGNTPRKQQQQMMFHEQADCEEFDDSASMSSSSSEVVMVPTEDGGTLAVQVEYLDEELYDRIFGAPDAMMAGSLPDLPNNEAGLKVLREQWLPSWRRPCTFFMEGSCRRKHCKFSHDLSSITCRFWEESSCLKGSECPFMHGYPVVTRRRNRSEGDSRAADTSSSSQHPQQHHRRKPGAAGEARQRHRLSSFELSSDTDFPALAHNADNKESERAGSCSNTSGPQQQQNQSHQPQHQMRKKTKYTPITAAIIQSGSSGASNNRGRRRRHTHSAQRSATPDSIVPLVEGSGVTTIISSSSGSGCGASVMVATTSGSRAAVAAPTKNTGAKPKPRRNRKGGGCGGGGSSAATGVAAGGGGKDGGGGRVHRDGTMSDY